MGLGLSHKKLLGLTPRERDALIDVWERQSKLAMAMYFQLRADIHNSSENCNRSDKRRWTAQDFGAAEPEGARQENSQEFQRAKVRTTAIMQFGAGEESVLKKLKGRTIPVALQAKIDAGKSAPKRERRQVVSLRKAPVTRGS